ncbi:glycosyltransferase [Candidatus Saccharibacteria bacterium]|nr:glycosyltransferase [Candidatus Saccharibacteria bacterium]
MVLWLGVWAGVVVAEALLYALGPKLFRSFAWMRYVCVGIVWGALIGADIGMMLVDWRCWIFVILFSPYRLINLARLSKFRLQADRLRAVSLRAHGWLIAAQITLFLIWVAVRSLPIFGIAMSLAVLQLVGVIVLLRASLRTWRHAKPAEPTAYYTDSGLPSLSILIPARDETDALRTCLDSLVASDYPKMEIIVLDDCSVGKKTPEIIRSYAHQGVRFVKGVAPPEGWVPKNFAYEQLRHESAGEMILYCGVDTTFEARTVRRMVETLIARKKEMMSVLPTRLAGDGAPIALLQSMRYYWELCLPRRMFKRPPVLSSCWLVRAELLDELGGLKAVAQSVSPEAHFARLAVAKDVYTFVRSHGDLQVHSSKSFQDQMDTTIRMRYPQLHRRLELVAATALFEAMLFIGPFIGLSISMLLLPQSGALFVIWFASVVVVETMYYLISVTTKLTSPVTAILTALWAFIADIVMVHVSMLRYEFGTVNWKGRNVCIAVMRVEPHLPKLPD